MGVFVCVCVFFPQPPLPQPPEAAVMKALLPAEGALSVGLSQMRGLSSSPLKASQYTTQHIFFSCCCFSIVAFYKKF